MIKKSFFIIIFISVILISFLLAGYFIRTKKPPVRNQMVAITDFSFSPKNDDFIVKSTDIEFAYENKSGKIKTSFKEKPNDYFLKISRENSPKIYFRLLENAEIGKINPSLVNIQENKAIYKDVFGEIDLAYTVDEERILEEYIIKNQKTAEKIKNLSQKIKAENLIFQPRSNGTIQIQNPKTKDNLFIIPKPVMYELENKNEKNFGLHFEVSQKGEDYILTKIIDPEGLNWLTSPQRKYPVVIDATIVAASGIIVAWSGTAASIPSGWSRDTNLDGKYLLGASVGIGSTGGSTTHTHNVPNHTHSQGSHTHTAAVGAASSGVQTTSDTSSPARVRDTHSHSTSVTSTQASMNTASVTLNETSNDPPYYEVIWIQSQGSTGISSSAIAFFNSPFPPAGWIQANGSDGSPDLRGKFLKGAASGNNAGGTGGSLTHTHNNSPHSHNNTHTHTVSWGASSANEINGGSGGGAVSCDDTHTHSGSGGSSSDANPPNTGSTSVTINPASSEPPYKSLMAIQNKSAGDYDVPKGIIAAWTGSVDDIPSGWELCNGSNNTPNLTDYFIKVANDSIGIGSTGGSVGHNHTAQSHTHTHNHTHTITTGTASCSRDYPIATPAYIARSGHTHPITLNTNSPTIEATTITVDTTSDTRPPYFKVAFIQYQCSWLNPHLCMLERTSSGLRVKWKDLTDCEAGFKIEKKTDEGSWENLTITAADTEYYDDSSVSNNHTYQYRIRAQDSAGTTYTAWCETPIVDLSLGNFDFEGLDGEGIEINQKIEQFDFLASILHYLKSIVNCYLPFKNNFLSFLNKGNHAKI